MLKKAKLSLHYHHVAFPPGGLGAGMICLEGAGGLTHVSIHNGPRIGFEPYTFAALCVKGTPQCRSHPGLSRCQMEDTWSAREWPRSSGLAIVGSSVTSSYSFAPDVVSEKALLNL